MTPNVVTRVVLKLERSMDHDKPCCENTAYVDETVARFGPPTHPIILRDTSIGDHVMQKKYENSGILFRNDDKDPNDVRDRDYQGTITVAGTEYWLTGWVKEGKNGKFLSLSVKLKKPAPADKSKSLGDELNDAIGF
jgi:hypothetical protein